MKKKFVGDFLLDNGLHVFLRSFNVFNLTLWDDVMKPFGELRDDDILVSKGGLNLQLKHLEEEIRESLSMSKTC